MLVFDMKIEGQCRSIFFLTILKNTFVFLIQLILLPPDELSLSQKLLLILAILLILCRQLLQFRLELEVLPTQGIVPLLKK
jgi:hypothetical protein